MSKFERRIVSMLLSIVLLVGCLGVGLIDVHAEEPSVEPEDLTIEEMLDDVDATTEETLNEIDSDIEEISEGISEEISGEIDLQPLVAGEVQTYGDYEYVVLPSGNVEIAGYTGSEETITIPYEIAGKYVTSIGEQAFYRNKQVKTINMPNTVTSFQYQAFWGSAIETVNLSADSKLTTIGAQAFMESALKTFTIPSQVSAIQDYAFCHTLLEAMVIPDNVVSLGQGVFMQCYSLRDCTYNRVLTEIPDSLFWYCDSLTNFTIPNQVKVIGEMAFEYCSSLETIVIPNSVQRIKDYAFEASGLTSIEIPNSVTALGKYVFAGCKNLKTVSVRDGLTYIPESAFAWSGVESIEIGSKVRRIEKYAFKYDDKLVSVVIPDSVTELQYEAFGYAKNLENIKFSPNLRKMTCYTFRETKWYDNQPEGVVYAGPVLYSYKGVAPQNTKVVIPEKTNGIAAGAFKNQEGLTEVTIPSTVTVVGDMAFLGCSMNGVTIPANVSEIGVAAFGYRDLGWSCFDRNKSCYSDELAGWTYVEKIENFVITGYSGSAAEKYAKDNGFTFVSIGNKYSNYDGCEFYKRSDGKTVCYKEDGTPVINEFKCDGTYTYFFQADGTAMEDRLTYHPDGVHVIYFDEYGHEVFSDFAHVTKTIAGKPVDDYCFFDSLGHMYVDTMTYDKTGTKLYYINPYGLLEHTGWFAFSGKEFDKGLGFTGRQGGYGYANPDGSLYINATTYDWEGRLCYLQGDGHMFR